MDLDEMRYAVNQFHKAAEELEKLDPSVLRTTERHMRKSALKRISHSIERLDSMIESENIEQKNAEVED